jgi:hypothetical protein
MGLAALKEELGNTPLHQAVLGLKEYPATASWNAELRAGAAALIAVYAGQAGGQVVRDAEENAQRLSLNLNSIRMVFALLVATNRLGSACYGTKTKWYTTEHQGRAARLIEKGFAWANSPSKPQ